MVKWQNPIFFDQFWLKFDLIFDINAQIQIVAKILMDFSNKFGLKKSIKSQFEYDLDQISGRPRSNRISLNRGYNPRVLKWQTLWIFNHFAVKTLFKQFRSVNIT